MTNTSGTPVVPPAVLHDPPNQPTATPTQPPVQPAQPAVPPHQTGPMPPSNWSHFKPELAGNPDEDMEVHFLRKKMIGWTLMQFKRVSKSKNFSRRS